MDTHRNRDWHYCLPQAILVTLLFITGCAQDTVDVTIWEDARGVDTVALEFQEGIGNEVILNNPVKERVVKKITHAITTIDERYAELPLNEDLVEDPNYRFSIKENGSEVKLTFSQSFEIRDQQSADYVKQYLEAVKKRLEAYEFD